MRPCQRVPERRADRRHPLRGFARVAPRVRDLPRGGAPPGPGPGQGAEGRTTERWGADLLTAEWYGAVVDVSARGLRLRVRPGTDLPDGLRCDVVLEVSVPGSGPDTPAVRLHGVASLVRRSASEGDPMEEVAFRFDEPLRVGDAFGAPARAAARPEGSLA